MTASVFLMVGGYQSLLDFQDSGSDLGSVSVFVGPVTNLPAGNESLEDVDKNAINVADCIERDTAAATLFRMKRCLSQRDAKLVSGIKGRNNIVHGSLGSAR